MTYGKKKALAHGDSKKVTLHNCKPGPRANGIQSKYMAPRLLQSRK
jgi:hypothetical protein